MFLASQPPELSFLTNTRVYIYMREFEKKKKKKNVSDQRTKKVDQSPQLQLNHPSTQYLRHRPFLGASARETPLCPNPRHATSKPSFYRSTHTGRLEDITSRPSGQSTVGFKLLGGFVSQRLRKLMGICAWRRRSPTVDPPVVRSAGHVVEGTVCINMRPTAVILETNTDYPCKMLRKWGTVLRRRLLQ